MVQIVSWEAKSIKIQNCYKKYSVLTSIKRRRSKSKIDKLGNLGCHNPYLNFIKLGIYAIANFEWVNQEICRLISKYDKKDSWLAPNN